jgi:hypothetical protein
MTNGTNETIWSGGTAFENDMLPPWLIDAHKKWSTEPLESPRTAFYYRVAAANDTERGYLGRTFIVGVRRKGDWYYWLNGQVEPPALEPNNDIERERE